MWYNFFCYILFFRCSFIKLLCIKSKIGVFIFINCYIYILLRKFVKIYFIDNVLVCYLFYYEKGFNDKEFIKLYFIVYYECLVELECKNMCKNILLIILFIFICIRVNK